MRTQAQALAYAAALARVRAQANHIARQNQERERVQRAIKLGLTPIAHCGTCSLPACPYLSVRQCAQDRQDAFEAGVQARNAYNRAHPKDPIR